MIDLLSNAEQFIARVNRGLDELKVDRSLLVEADHICYRVQTDERYRELREELRRQYTLLGETDVNGRPIATFQLDTPISTGGWRISYLELPAPKPGSEYTEGLEHVEFVVLGGDLARFETAHPHLADSFSRKGMDKPINPELGLKGAGISVKFHKLPLGEVVRLERLLK